MAGPSGRNELSRRAALTVTATGLVTSLSGCLGSATSPTESADFGGWFDDVSNYRGVVDETGNSEVEITVGAKGNQGNFAFAPAAVTVSTGTTVIWRWNGEGSIHNVVDTEGRFESEIMSRAGATFEHTFERNGTYKYYCGPHKQSGMKGAVVVE